MKRELPTGPEKGETTKVVSWNRILAQMRIILRQARVNLDVEKRSWMTSLQLCITGNTLRVACGRLCFIARLSGDVSKYTLGADPAVMSARVII